MQETPRGLLKTFQLRDGSPLISESRPAVSGVFEKIRVGFHFDYGVDGGKIWMRERFILDFPEKSRSIDMSGLIPQQFAGTAHASPQRHLTN